MLSNGKIVPWSNEPNLANIKIADVSPLQHQYWGKTFEFNGQTINAADAISNPSSINGMVENGKLTDAGASAFEKAGINNAALDASGHVAGGPTNFCASFGPLGCLELSNGPWSFFGAHLIEGVVWGGILALGIKFLGPMLGLEQSAADAAALATFGGKN
mgnify:CR=1 FL=1